MSGLEILGAAAASIQLIDCGINIALLLSNTYQQVRDAPSWVKARTSQVQSLIAIAESIKANPRLCTNETTLIINNCLSQAKALHEILETAYPAADFGTGRKLLKAIDGVFKEKRVLELFDSLERDKTSLTLCITTLQQSAENVEATYDAVTPLIGYSTETRCLAALFLTDPKDDRAKLITAKGRRVQGTCQWITSKQVYSAWLASVSGFLWLSGDPAKGKTMMSIFLTEELERIVAQRQNIRYSSVDSHGTRASSIGSTLLIYYFCDNRDEKRNTTVAVLRGLILQLLQQEKSLYRHILPVFQLQQETLFTKSSFETLWRIFESMIRDPCIESIYCVLDGLDECEEPGLDVLAEKLADLYHNLYFSVSSHSHQAGEGEQTLSPRPADLVPLEASGKSVGSSSPAVLTSSYLHSLDGDARLQSMRIKMIVVSRERPRCLLRAFSRFPHITLDSKSDEEVHRDITAYITAKVDQLSAEMSYPKELRASVGKALSEQAHGTYLWVGFVVQELRNNTRLEVEKAIKNLPSGLEKMYERMLSQIPKDRRDIAASILKWVTLAVRPLTLTELGVAVGIRQSAHLSLEETTRDLVDFCGCLLTVTDTVDLVHHSAKEFLLHGDPAVYRELKVFGIKEESNVEITQACMEYFSNILLKEGAVNLSDREIEAKFPLLSYAVRHWPEHAQKCSGTDAFDLSHPFYHKESPLRNYWWRSYASTVQRRLYNNDISDSTSLLDAAAYFGIVPLVQKLLRKRWKLPPLLSRLNKRSIRGQTPLGYAALKGHLAVVKVLLEHKADINFNEGQNIFTALHLAARGGFAEIVQLLLDQGANVNAVRKNTGLTPLHVAAVNGNEAVATLLLNHGADATRKDNMNRTPLDWAAIFRHEQLVRLILDFRGGLQPLHSAVFHGREQQVRVLSDQGARVDAEDDHGMTPLSWAIWRGSEAIVQLLLQHGADVKHMSLHPRWLLSDEGTGVARLLVEARMDVNERDSVFIAPLHVLTFIGRAEAARLLLESGADADFVNGDFSHEALAQLLIDHGVDGARLFSKTRWHRKAL